MEESSAVFGVAVPGSVFCLIQRRSVSHFIWQWLASSLVIRPLAHNDEQLETAYIFSFCDDHLSPECADAGAKSEVAIFHPAADTFTCLPVSNSRHIQSGPVSSSTASSPFINLFKRCCETKGQEKAEAGQEATGFLSICSHRVSIYFPSFLLISVW